MSMINFKNIKDLSRKICRNIATSLHRLLLKNAEKFLLVNAILNLTL